MAGLLGAGAMVVRLDAHIPVAEMTHDNWFFWHECHDAVCRSPATGAARNHNGVKSVQGAAADAERSKGGFFTDQGHGVCIPQKLWTFVICRVVTK